MDWKDVLSYNQKYDKYVQDCDVRFEKLRKRLYKTHGPRAFDLALKQYDKWFKLWHKRNLSPYPKWEPEGKA